MAEPMAGERGAEPSETPISASTCWPWAAAGRARRHELARLLAQAGFAGVRLADRAADADRLIVAMR